MATGAAGPCHCGKGGGGGVLPPINRKDAGRRRPGHRHRGAPPRWAPVGPSAVVSAAHEPGRVGCAAGGRGGRGGVLAPQVARSAVSALRGWSLVPKHRLTQLCLVWPCTVLGGNLRCRHASQARTIWHGPSLGDFHAAGGDDQSYGTRGQLRVGHIFQ
jgi:hypothetical protein